MDNKFEKKLDFDSDTFEDMKRDMTFVLQRLIGNMEEKGSNEGTMTLKIDITMIKQFIPNYSPDIEGETREVSKPQFKHKVTSAVKISDEKSGSLNNEMECIFDKETGTYVMVPIANTQQRSIFDADFQKKDESEENGEVIDGTAIEGGDIPALPGPQKEGDVIDGEFREVDSSKDESEHIEKSEEETEPGEGLEDITDELLREDGEGDDGYSYDDPEDGQEE